MILVNNLSVEYSAKPILNDISFHINENEKIALVGKNGAGKSTLLKILAGKENQSKGRVAFPAHYIIGYLPQQMKPADDTSVIEEVKKTFSERLELEKKLQINLMAIEEFIDYDSPEFFKLLEKTEENRTIILNNPLANIEAEIEKTLTGLGFKKDEFHKPTNTFSGGWRMRIELAKILLMNPDILLLDEPTNHLDIESIQWLEQFLRTKAKTVILVSHDKAFLDNVTTRTIEISCGKIYDYNVSYSQFRVLREERVSQQKLAYEKQQKEIANIKDFIERFRYKATKAVQVQSRIKQLEKIIPIEIDEEDKSSLRLKFPPVERSGDFPLTIENVSKSYGEKNVFSNADFILRRGEKVAFVGKNGEGKSTLVKCIIGEIPYSGVLKIGHNVKIGYFAQNQAQLLNPDITVFDTIDRIATGEIRTKINDILGAFMFGGEESEKKVAVLSGGEKTRLAMIKLLLEPINFLILDEPTNHLDIKTKEILKEALIDFSGTLIVVSHDREFLDGLVDKVFEFSGGKVIEHHGGIYDFLQKKKIDSLVELEKTSKNCIDLKKDSSDSNKTIKKAETENISGYDSYRQSKQKDKLQKNIQKKIKNSEEEVQRLENVLKEIEEELSKGNSSAEILQKYQTVNDCLKSEMEKWEKYSEEFENLKNQDI